MSVTIDVEVPEWLVNAAAAVLDNPEAGLYVAFVSAPEAFYLAVKVGLGGLEYASEGGRLCAQPIEDVVAYRIGPDGEAVGVGGVTIELVGESIVEIEKPVEEAVEVEAPKGKKAKGK